MKANARTNETEIKLPAADVASAKRLLYRAGFRVHKRRVFEDNTVFDTPAWKLRKQASLLRLREAGGKSVVTYKGRPIASKHKSREELEVEVSDPGMLRAIAGRLGFEPIFRYQKYRTEYKQPSRSGIATLDETPIGLYLELEGQPDWIDGTALRLGYSERDYITASYARLYSEWCAQHRVKPTNMVF
jgi:adenylate cyclase class 2